MKSVRVAYRAWCRATFEGENSWSFLSAMYNDTLFKVPKNARSIDLDGKHWPRFCREVLNEKRKARHLSESDILLCMARSKGEVLELFGTSHDHQELRTCSNLRRLTRQFLDTQAHPASIPALLKALLALLSLL